MPITNLAIALALTLTGAGRFSLDHVLGIRLPRVLVVAVAIVEAILVISGLMRRPPSAPTPAVEHPPRTAVTADQGAGTLSS